MYNNILDPNTGKWIKTNSQQGKNTILNFLKQLKGGRPYSSYTCKLGEEGIDGTITVDNCNEQWDSSNIKNKDGTRFSRCKLTKNNVCRKSKNASPKRAKKNWSKLKNLKNIVNLSTSVDEQEVEQNNTTEVHPLSPKKTVAHVFEVNCPDEYSPRFNFENGDLKLLLDELANPEYGDLIQDCNEQYRATGVYIINRDDFGNLFIEKLDTEVEDYGHVGSNFSIAPEFTPGYWSKAYIDWHGDGKEPLSRNIWSNITEEDLVESERDGAAVCDYHYDKGTLRFRGTKDYVINKLDTFRANGIKNLYFYKNINHDNMDEIFDHDWEDLSF